MGGSERPARGGPPDPADVADLHEIEGFQVWVGRSARDNDVLSLKIARPRDLWLHAAGVPGSHVLVRREDDRDPPRSVLEEAARLAVRHSKARDARGKVPVHWCEAREVSKGRGAPAGQVRLRRYDVLKVYPPADV